MTTSTYFKEGIHNIGYIGIRFREVFGSMPFTEPKKFKIQMKKLERPMNDKAILAELQPAPITLENLAYALENIGRKGYYLFYIKDATGTLWAVGARWYAHCGDWRVGAYSVESPNDW